MPGGGSAAAGERLHERSQAVDWWNELARPLYEQGVAFFKNDDGEYLPEGGALGPRMKWR